MWSVCGSSLPGMCSSADEARHLAGQPGRVAVRVEPADGADPAHAVAGRPRHQAAVPSPLGAATPIPVTTARAKGGLVLAEAFSTALVVSCVSPDADG